MSTTGSEPLGRALIEVERLREVNAELLEALHRILLDVEGDIYGDKEVKVGSPYIRLAHAAYEKAAKAITEAEAEAGGAS